jgi:hypothetical protein
MPYCTSDDVEKNSQITYDQFVKDMFFSQTTFKIWIENTVIPWAQTLIDEHCGRDFTTHTDQTVYLDGTGKLVIVPTALPIISVKTLSKNSDYFGKGTWTDQSTDDYQVYDSYIVHKSGFDEGFKNWKLTYTYGYATVPSTVFNVCVEICTKILQYMVINKLGPILPSAGPFGTIKQIIPEREIFPSELKRLLSAYVKPRFAAVQ